MPFEVLSVEFLVGEVLAAAAVPSWCMRETPRAELAAAVNDVTAAEAVFTMPCGAYFLAEARLLESRRLFLVLLRPEILMTA